MQYPYRTQKARKIAFARKLRKTMTLTETILWKSLRKHQLGGLKFRRQAVFGPYIIDFLCYSHRLVLEVDGAIHRQQKEYDHARDEYLRDHGFWIVRVSNHQVMTSLSSVLQLVEIAAKSERPYSKLWRGTTNRFL